MSSEVLALPAIRADRLSYLEQSWKRELSRKADNTYLKNLRENRLKYLKEQWSEELNEAVAEKQEMKKKLDFIIGLETNVTESDNSEIMADFTSLHNMTGGGETYTTGANISVTTVNFTGEKLGGITELEQKKLYEIWFIDMETKLLLCVPITETDVIRKRRLLTRMYSQQVSVSLVEEIETFCSEMEQQISEEDIWVYKKYLYLNMKLKKNLPEGSLFRAKLFIDELETEYQNRQRKEYVRTHIIECFSKHGIVCDEKIDTECNMSGQTFTFRDSDAINLEVIETTEGGYLLEAVGMTDNPEGVASMGEKEEAVYGCSQFCKHCPELVEELKHVGIDLNVRNIEEPQRDNMRYGVREERRHRKKTASSAMGDII